MAKIQEKQDEKHYLPCTIICFGVFFDSVAIDCMYRIYIHGIPPLKQGQGGEDKNVQKGTRHGRLLRTKKSHVQNVWFNGWDVRVPGT